LLALLSNCSSGNNLELSNADPDEAEMFFWQKSDKQKVNIALLKIVTPKLLAVFACY